MRVFTRCQVVRGAVILPRERWLVNEQQWQPNGKFSLLTKVLGALGLSPKAVDDLAQQSSSTLSGATARGH